MPTKLIALKKSKIPKFSNGREFDRLSDGEKEKVWESYDRPIPLSETRPMNAADRAHRKRAAKKMGRPKTGEGSKLISVTIELELLRQADDFAKKHGLKRAQLIARALRSVLV